ncbi:MAG: prolyl oligopeptidase family serine peptidase [Filimonas sp.]|nr:prolyl oligopeptidase family serine peptidase [Filimonas sp.]
MRISPLLCLGGILFCTMSHAQKKPLDHTVYDGWQSIGERMISNDGKVVVYAVNPQEGDGTLFVQQKDGKKIVEIARGYGAKITENSQYVICKIKPTFKETRDAKIKKKRPDEMPKDSLAIINLATGAVVKYPRIKSYKLPEDNGTWLAYLEEKALPDVPGKQPVQDSATRIKRLEQFADSLAHAADSIRTKLAAAKTGGMSVLQPQKKETRGAGTKAEEVEEGTQLTIRNLSTGDEQKIKLVNEYAFDKKGKTIAMFTTKKNSDSTSKSYVVWYDLATAKSNSILAGLNEVKNLSFDEAGAQLAFVAEKDSSLKAAQKFYKLFYYKPGQDSAQLIADRTTKGLPAKWTVSENGNISFSKSGQRLFIGTAPILPVKDTTLPEFDRVNVDVWNYKDDDLQTVQLFNLNRDLKRSYLASYDWNNKQLVQLADDKFRRVQPSAEGDGRIFYGGTDSGKRVAAQWQGFTYNDVYAINPVTGAKSLIQKDFKGNTFTSYTGKYLVFYNDKQRKYSIYNADTKTVTPLAADITFPLYDEENDVPDDPNPYGIAKWVENDAYVLLYDRYDIWKVDPTGKQKSVVITNGRKDKISYRYVNTDEDEKFLKEGQQLLLRSFDEKDKSAGIATLALKSNATLVTLFREKIAIGASPLFPGIVKAKNADVLLYSKETFEKSSNLYTRTIGATDETALSNINPQQANYLWGTAELYKWKAYTGKQTEGVLYKPENFDPKKKYPMIVYFYERNNNTLYNYQAPAPTPSRLNVTFFVSRGYVVFVPDIWYVTGHPGKSAYDYIVSGTRALIKDGFIDSTKLGLQGQSWGGYQTAYLVTQTNLYAAAWAGAPVANMFSAYGGIRWESGLNRQFQYEKSQSRIGATIWEKPNLYVENSPLFHLQKTKTPMVIMSNDADGAVPWYQGIELFTAMRRLNKPVWLLNYNGEAHNLVERKNRKDIQVREQEFFDWLLKGEKPAPWIAEGVPALMKGRTWGL